MRRRRSNIESSRRAKLNVPRGGGGFSSFEHIIGDSVSAMTPDTTTEPASAKANSRNSAPVSPGDEADRRVDGGQRDGHRDDRAGDLPCADYRGVVGRQALFDVAVDVLDHDDRVVHHEADGEHEGQQASAG